MPRSRTVSIDVSAYDHTIRLNGSFTPADPGRLSGPPERCWPPEPAEFEIEEAWIVWEVADDLGGPPRVILVPIDYLIDAGEGDIANELAELAREKLESSDWETPDGHED